MTSSRFRAVQLLVLLASAIGTVALFLHFTYDTTPLKGITEAEVWKLALPFFLAPAMLALDLRWILAGSLSRAERGLAHVLSLTAVIATLWLYVNSLADEGGAGWADWLSYWTPLALLAILGALVWRANRRGLPTDAKIVATLTAAYLPNASLCLIGFYDQWQTGAYLTLIVTAVYLVAAGLIWRSDPALPAEALA